jgi:hypothetical protein
MVVKNNNQVKSKNRVTDHGEVFTSEREVNAMLDLVKQETERIDSKFLEPACGNGNFLTEVLRRKLEVVKRRYGKHSADYEKYSFIAISSIYGVELLADNAVECKQRLFDVFDNEYRKNCKGETSEDFLEAIKYILTKNILCGDALTLKQNDGNPIIFSEWSLVTNSLVRRRDYRLDQLLEAKEDQMSISMIGWEYDNELKAFIPSPISEFPLTDYRRVQYA